MESLLRRWSLPSSLSSSISSLDACRSPSAFAIASSTPIVLLALRTSLVVGTLLNLINQGDALFGAGHIEVLKMCLTYCVPYCVATYSATSISLRNARVSSHGA